MKKEEETRSHFALLANSARLQRLHAYLLKCKGPRSTMQIINGAKICAVNSAIHELRRNGINIPPAQYKGGDYYYQIEGEA